MKEKKNKKKKKYTITHWGQETERVGAMFMGGNRMGGGMIVHGVNLSGGLLCCADRVVVPPVLLTATVGDGGGGCGVNAGSSSRASASTVAPVAVTGREAAPSLSDVVGA